MGISTATIARLGTGVLDLVLPPRCPSCRDIVADDGSFCAACWNSLDFLTAPMCACCGLPFPYDVGSDAVCGNCAAVTPAYDSARATLVYNDASAGLVLGLKYGDRTQLARIMAGLMMRAAADALSHAPLIVPVPLHPKRLRQRFFNQSQLIASALGRMSGAPVDADALDRRRDTPPSRGLSRSARYDNVRGAIAVRPSAIHSIAGRSVLVVDDVMTTGATAEACARPLKRAGATRVDIVTFARVTHDGVN